jgi:hypothetical protein
MAKFIALGASAGFVEPHDPVLGVSMSAVFWVAGSVELAAGCMCLFGAQPRLQLAFVLWIAGFWAAYPTALSASRGHSGCGVYFGSLGEAFGIGPGLAFAILEGASYYLLIGGLAVMLGLWIEDRKCVKTACPHCGGHIAFPAEGIGRQTDCPHCAARIILLEPRGKHVTS